MAVITEQINFNGCGDKRLFYISQIDDNSMSVIAHCYTITKGKIDIKLNHLENYLWDLHFEFEYPGKYAFVIFENENPKLILMVTIDNF